MTQRSRFAGCSGAPFALSSLSALALVATTTTVTSNARADQNIGGPGPDATALVTAPTAGEDAPTWERIHDETTATVSAGGQLATGNSQLAALTANGQFAMRRGEDGFGASLLGNYGQGAPFGSTPVETTENLQGRLRYDRYLSDRLSLFLIGTGWHDRFQGLEFRFNTDPGAKYLFVNTDQTKLWGEAGYDVQYDFREGSAVWGTGIKRKAVDHSIRLFAGFKHAFNKSVTVTTGFEYLQSFVDSADQNLDNDSRINYDLLFASQIGGGLSLGLGFTARYDYHPLPGKTDTDTTTTISLIYALAQAPTIAQKPSPPPCVPAPAPATTPPAPVPEGPAAPAPATIPAPATMPAPAPASGTGSVAPAATPSTAAPSAP